MGFDVAGIGRAAAQAYDATENAIDEAGNAIDGGVKDTEEAVDAARKGIVDFGEQHGGVVGGAAAHLVSSQIGLSEGAALAVYDAAKGVATVGRDVGHLTSPTEWALHPERNIERAQTAGNVLTGMAKLGTPVSWALQPKENANAARALWNGATEGYQEAAKSGDWSKFGGRAVVDVGSMFVGAGDVNAAAKGAKGASAAAHAAEGLNAGSRAAEVVADTGRAASGTRAAANTTRSAEAAGADLVARLPWSEPVKLETLRANRHLIPKEHGVYAFTRHADPLQRDIPAVPASGSYPMARESTPGILYVGMTRDQGGLRSRLSGYLRDPDEVKPLSQNPNKLWSSAVSHAGKSLLLTEIQQLSRASESGIWVRWATHSDPATVEKSLIEHLQPSLNTEFR